MSRGHRPKPVSQRWKSFERKVAKQLGEWWCGDSKAFARLAGSGSFPRRKADADIVGVKDASKMFPFAVECKRRQSKSASSKSGFHRESIFSLLVAAKHPLKKWWLAMNELECVKRGGKMRWLVVFDRAGEHLLVFGRQEWQWLTSWVGKPGVPFLRFDEGRDATTEDGADSLYMCSFKRFLDWCDPVTLGAPKPDSLLSTAASEREGPDETDEVRAEAGEVGQTQP